MQMNVIPGLHIPGARNEKGGVTPYVCRLDVMSIFVSQNNKTIADDAEE